jgi:hypothetical protein
MGLLNTTILAKLTAGKYQIKLVSFKEVVNDKGGYVELSLKFPDRIIRHNVFPGKSMDYTGKALRQQLGLEAETDLGTLLNLCQASDQLFTVVSYNDYGLNLAFHEAITVEDKEVKA